MMDLHVPVCNLGRCRCRLYQVVKAKGKEVTWEDGGNRAFKVRGAK